MENDFLHLPRDLYPSIFRHLKPLDLVRLSSTCESLSQLILDPSIWKSIWNTKWMVDPPRCPFQTEKNIRTIRRYLKQKQLKGIYTHSIYGRGESYHLNLNLNLSIPTEDSPFPFSFTFKDSWCGYNADSASTYKGSWMVLDVNVEDDAKHLKTLLHETDAEDKSIHFSTSKKPEQDLIVLPLRIVLFHDEVERYDSDYSRSSTTTRSSSSIIEVLSVVIRQEDNSLNVFRNETLSKI